MNSLIKWGNNHNGDKTQLVLLKQIIGNFPQNMRNAHISISGDILKIKEDHKLMR